MEKDQTLFLLTKNFPFGKGEQYLWEELKVLSGHFQKIIIYPNDHYRKEESVPPGLPPNAEVLNFNADLAPGKLPVSSWFFLAGITLREFFSTNDKKHFFSQFRWNILQFRTQQVIAEQLAVHLKKNKLCGAVFYSYWFHKSAILLSILRKKGVISSFVSRAHSVDLYHQHWGLLGDDVKVPPYKMFKLRMTSNLFCISNHGADHLKAEFPALSDRILVSRLGVTPGEKAENNKAQNEFHVVSCAALNSNKRIALLARALQHSPRNIRWTHFGDGPEMKTVQDIVAAFPANIKAELKGNTPNREIKQFYSNTPVDLFVNLSRVEGLPVSVMEAMAFAIPALATGVNGTPEAVIEGRTGSLLPVELGPEELIERIHGLMDRPDALKQMGSNALALCKERFSAEKNYEEFACLLKK